MSKEKSLKNSVIQMILTISDPSAATQTLWAVGHTLSTQIKSTAHTGLARTIC